MWVGAGHGGKVWEGYRRKVLVVGWVWSSLFTFPFGFCSSPGLLHLPFYLAISSLPFGPCNSTFLTSPQQPLHLHSILLRCTLLFL